MSHADTELPSLSSTQLAAALFALALGGFAIGTGEFSIMGLLPQVAAAFDVTEPYAGHLISAYALGVVVGAPLIAIVAARCPRRLLVMLLMVCYAIGNLGSALAAEMPDLLMFRFLSGMPHGAYFGVAALIAAALAGPGRRGYAVGRVMLGLTVAALIGNPIAVWLGQFFSWRWAFGLVGILAITTVALIVRYVPAPPGEMRSSPLQELRGLRNGAVWMTLGIGSIGFGGMFAVMSYVAPALTQVTGLSDALVPVALAVFGAGMLIGNWVGGWAADRALMPSIGLILLWSLGCLIAFPWMLETPTGAFAGVFFTGTAVALGPPLQVRLMDVAADAQTLAASLNHSAFNAANALGAWLGGLTISAGWGVASTAWVGAGLAVGGLVVFGFAWRQERRLAKSPARHA